MTYEFDPTPAERSILGQIRVNQSNGKYNILFGGESFEDFVTFPVWSGRRWHGHLTHAAGAYQFEPATWAWVAEQAGLSDFTPESQDIGALWLLRHADQQSQWGTNFTDDGFVYVFAA